MTTTPSRESIITRIRKLRAFTLENGASESEVLQASAHIAKLMAAHGITETESSIRAAAASCVRDHFYVPSNVPSEWDMILVTLNKLYSVRCWRSSEWEDLLGLGQRMHLTKYHFFGTDMDVAAALTTAEICHHATLGESTSFIKALRGTPRKEREFLVQSFRLGLAERLKARLQELIPPERAAGSGTALLVLKHQLVTEEFAKLGINLRSRSAGSIPIDPSAYQAGQAAGSRVDLGQGPKLRSSQRAIQG